MGLLDILQGNGGGSQYGGLLYPSPVIDADKEAQQRFLQALTAAGETGQAPGLPQPSPFGDPTQFSVGAPTAAPPAPPPVFNSGAAPFGFAGAGSNLVNPSQIAPPAAAPQATPPIAAPQAAPAPPAAAPAPADEQADPINVGSSYAMPRVGSADLFEPDDTTPAKATPTQGQLPGAPAAAPVASPATAPFSLGGRLAKGTQGFLGNLALGPIGALAAGTGALITGQSTDPGSIKAEQANLTARALAAKGVAPDIVAAAVHNPELMKTLIAQNFGPDKFQHVTRKDQFGGEEIGAFDPTTGKTNFGGGAGGADGASAPTGGVQGMVDNITQARNSGASRADLIKLVPTQYQGYISALLDGKATPANMGRGQSRAALMTLAHSIDPTFDETTIPARIQTAIDFTPKGKSGASIVAFNTVQHHIGKLSDDFENLGTAGQGGFQAINSLRNGFATQTPYDPQRQKAVQAVNDDIKAVTDEMSAAYKAGHVSDSEIKSWNSLVNSNLPLTQARQAISDFVDLLNGKRDALNDVHRQIIGGDAAIINKEENATITKKAHDRNTVPSGAIAEGATATNPTTGQTLTFRGGKWQ